MTDIVINDSDARDQYVASASQTEFDFTFALLDEDDLKVTQETAGTVTTLVLGDDYTVTINADGTGSITLSSGATVDDVLTLYRDTVIERSFDYATLGDFFAAQVNEELDRITTIQQELNTKYLRTMRMAPSDQGGESDMLLPAKADRAGKYLAFTAGGAAYASAGTGSDATLREELADPDTGNPLVYGVPKVYRPEDFSATTYGGLADVSTSLQQAIDACAAAGGGIVYCNGHIGIDDSVEFKENVVVDLAGHWLYPLSDANHITMRFGARLCNGVLDGRGVFASHNYLVSLIADENIRGSERPSPLFSNITMLLDDGADTGRHILYDATAGYIQETRLGSVSIYHGEVGLYLKAGASASNRYINGNNFSGLTFHDPLQSIVEDVSAASGDTDAITGNTYMDIQNEKNDGAAVVLSQAATMLGNLWDGPGLTLLGNYNLIQSAIFRMLLITFADSGRNNRIIAQDANYYDGRTRGLYGDDRSNYLNIHGQREFRDTFEGANLKPEWRLTATAGTPTGLLQETALGSTGYKLVGARYRMGTEVTGGDDTGNDAILDWGGIKSIQTGQQPVLHCTLLSGAATGLQMEIGFYKDADNFILLRSTVATPKWTAICRVGGVQTATDIVSGVTTSTSPTVLSNINFNQLQCLSIIVENGRVIFQHGNAGASANAAAYGRYVMNGKSGGQEVTITTNIPKNVSMQPYLRVATLADAEAVLFMYDVQILRKYLTVVG